MWRRASGPADLAFPNAARPAGSTPAATTTFISLARRGLQAENVLPTAMAETERHPFLHGLSKHRGAPPTVVVIFGASGDLTARKLIPAVYNPGYDNLLPADFHLIGYGRKPIPDDEFRSLAADAIKEFSRRELKDDVWNRVA